MHHEEDGTPRRLRYFLKIDGWKLIRFLLVTFVNSWGDSSETKGDLNCHVNFSGGALFHVNAGRAHDILSGI